MEGWVRREMATRPTMAQRVLLGEGEEEEEEEEEEEDEGVAIRIKGICFSR